MPIHVCSRRVALKVLAQGGAAGAFASACGGPSGASPASVGTLEVGQVTDYPVGSLEPVGNQPVAVGRDAKGLYAMTLTCTHTGCNMAIDGDVMPTGVRCGCHGSVFDANGAVVRGPAQDDLVHFAVTVDMNGVVTVHGDHEVAATTRTMVA